MGDTPTQHAVTKKKYPSYHDYTKYTEISVDLQRHLRPMHDIQEQDPELT